MYCSKCGKQIDEESKFCSYCGALLKAENQKPEKLQEKGSLKRKIIVGVLAFFAGSAVTFGWFRISQCGPKQETISAHEEKTEDYSIKEESTEESTEEITDESTKETVLETEPAAGWKQTEYGWWYDNGDGSYTVSGWQNIDGKWYCFNESGYMRTGWITSDGRDYYLNSDGSMAVNTWIDGNYYVGSDGAMYKNTITPDNYKVDGSGKITGKIGPVVGKTEYLGVYDEYNFTSLGSGFKITAISEDRIQGSYVTLEAGAYADFDVPLRENQFEINCKGVNLENDSGEIVGWIGENGNTITERFVLSSIEGKPAIFHLSYQDNNYYVNYLEHNQEYGLEYDPYYLKCGSLENDEDFTYFYSRANGDYWR